VKQWQAFVFDFDGVLADSVEVKTRAFAKLYEPYGLSIVDKVVEHHRANGGMNRYDKFRHYHGEFLGLPLSDTCLEQLARRFSSIVVDEVVASPEIPGANHFLEASSKVLPCFLNSATPEGELREIVNRRGIAPFVRDMLGAPSSKVNNLAILLDRYHLQPRRCLFFGDAISDYQAAMIHGVEFMGIVPSENEPLLKEAPDIKWKRDFYEVEACLTTVQG